MNLILAENYWSAGSRRCRCNASQ